MDSRKDILFSGLPAQKPEFMKALKQKQIVKNTNESGFDEIRKPSSDKVKRHQGF